MLEDIAFISSEESGTVSATGSSEESGTVSETNYCQDQRKSSVGWHWLLFIVNCIFINLCIISQLILGETFPGSIINDIPFNIAATADSKNLMKPHRPMFGWTFRPRFAGWFSDIDRGDLCQFNVVGTLFNLCTKLGSGSARVFKVRDTFKFRVAVSKVSCSNTYSTAGMATLHTALGSVRVASAIGRSLWSVSL